MATAYEKVQLARGKGRPSGLSFIQNIFPDFIELHGDRRFADDPAVIGGIATLGGRAVTVIAIEKGADTKDKSTATSVRRTRRLPEGAALMKQAEKFHRPVICFCGYLRRVLRHRRRGARAGTGHCRKPCGNDRAENAGHLDFGR